jgi:toxin ParE1/3/4
MPVEGKPVKLHAGARSDLQESVTFYRERGGERWVARFKLRVAEGFNAIAANPELYAPVPDMPGIRRIRLKQFPFSLLYMNRTDDIWVVAVAHGSRKPGYWRQRLP